jgi:hypothetical protein
VGHEQGVREGRDEEEDGGEGTHRRRCTGTAENRAIARISRGGRAATEVSCQPNRGDGRAGQLAGFGDILPTRGMDGMYVYGMKGWPPVAGPALWLYSFLCDPLPAQLRRRAMGRPPVPPVEPCTGPCGLRGQSLGVNSADSAGLG